MAQKVQVNFSISIDEEVKEKAEKTFERLELPMSTAVTAFLERVAKDQDLPYDMSLELFYSESNMRHIRGIIEKIRTGKAHFTEHELIEVEDDEPDDYNDELNDYDEPDVVEVEVEE